MKNNIKLIQRRIIVKTDFIESLYFCLRNEYGNEAYLKPCQTSVMKLFANIVNSWKLFSIFAKIFYLRCLTRFCIRLWEYVDTCPYIVVYCFQNRNALTRYLVCFILCKGSEKVVGRCIRTKVLLKVRFSTSKKICFTCFNENPLKMMKNDFYFILKETRNSYFCVTPKIFC